MRARECMCAVYNTHTPSTHPPNDDDRVHRRARLVFLLPPFPTYTGAYYGPKSFLPEGGCCAYEKIRECRKGKKKFLARGGGGA